MNSRALVAIYSSRMEAVIIASMLRGYGIHAHIDSEAHASTVYNSLALGGYRLFVFRDDFETASEILRQSGALDDNSQPAGVRRALLMFVLFWCGVNAATVLAGALSFGVMPWGQLLLTPLAAYSIPVEPRARADYFITDVKE